tara:strand:+ start:80 stop:493 length:414 start_codon:yes stop_codon:yes gene_type:complete
MSKDKFYRGYVSSREINGNVIPQSLQNLKIRDYANSKNLGFKLSITEHKSKNGFFALNDLMEKINKLDGIIFFSIYQLPEKKILRKKYLEYFIKKKKKIFFAFEDLELKTIEDINEIEMIFFISRKVAKINLISAKS